MKYLFIFIMFSLLGCQSTPKDVSSSQNYDNNKMGWVDENTFIVNAIGYPRLNGDNAESESYRAAYELGITKIADAFIKEININSADRVNLYYEMLENDKKLFTLISIIKNDVSVSSEKYNGIYSKVILKVYRKNLRKELNENKYILSSIKL